MGHVLFLLPWSRCPTIHATLRLLKEASSWFLRLLLQWLAKRRERVSFAKESRRGRCWTSLNQRRITILRWKLPLPQWTDFSQADKFSQGELANILLNCPFVTEVLVILHRFRLVTTTPIDTSCSLQSSEWILYQTCILSKQNILQTSLLFNATFCRIAV